MLALPPCPGSSCGLGLTSSRGPVRDVLLCGVDPSSCQPGLGKLGSLPFRLAGALTPTKHRWLPVPLGPYRLSSVLSTACFDDTNELQQEKVLSNLWSALRPRGTFVHAASLIQCTVGVQRLRFSTRVLGIRLPRVPVPPGSRCRSDDGTYR